MSGPSGLRPVRDLEEALALDQHGVVSSPLDVVGLIAAAATVSATQREELWARMFLEAPLPYWRVAGWARAASDRDLPKVLRSTRSSGWSCVEQFAAGETPPLTQVLVELAARFDAFDPDLYPWVYGSGDHAPPQHQKYMLGRELARSYVAQAAGAPRGREARVRLLLEQQSAWGEWLRLNGDLGFSPAAVSDAATLTLDSALGRSASAGVGGVGRTRVLLEQLTVARNPALGVVTATILPVDHDHHHLDGVVAPDLRENGLLVISDDFLAGVASAWRYVRSTLPAVGPTMLCFSIGTTAASVVQQLSGRSAELAVLAAIESAARRRSLRQNAAASASLRLYGADGAPAADPETGPASFEDKKYFSAVRHDMSTVVVHTDVARQWRRLNPDERVGDGPEVIASEFYRRDALRFLETRSLWKMALTVPAAVAAAYACLAILWQFYKMSASPPELDTVQPLWRLPLVPPALLAAELMCLAICLFIVHHCWWSIRSAIDSEAAAWLALSVCVAVVLAAQFSPVGVRGEGLLDNPVYSVLFGEPQLLASHVVAGGGGGFLALHTLTQTVGFVTILFGTSTFVLRLLLTRAHGEPRFEDRCALIADDWWFSIWILAAFLAVVGAYGFFRNALWYYYLATLPGVELIDNGGSFLAVMGPLVGICMVLILSVAVVWLFVLRSYLCRVVAASRGRAGYTSADVASSFTTLAQALYATAPRA